VNFGHLYVLVEDKISCDLATTREGSVLRFRKKEEERVSSSFPGETRAIHSVCEQLMGKKVTHPYPRKEGGKGGKKGRRITQAVL